MDVLNLVYPGCTGIYLADARHMVAFYGRKGNPKGGLSSEQCVEAIKVMKELNSWMGEPAQWKIRAVSLQEANALVVGLKRLEKENLRRTRLELQRQLSSLRTASSLSAEAKPFNPTTSSSADYHPPRVVEMPPAPPAPVAPPNPPGIGYIPPEILSDEEEDEGLTDSTTRSRPRGRRRRNKKNRPYESDTDSGTGGPSGGKLKKKDGVTNKVDIPSFGGRKEHPNDTAEAFRRWARNVSYQRRYYSDRFLSPLVIQSLKGDASDVFDWIDRTTFAGEDSPVDIGILLRKLHEHYCGSLTFREQRNAVENLRQGEREEAGNFLIRVGNAVSSLAKDWAKSITPVELESLQYEVSLNGVKPDIRHVLNSEAACAGILTPEEMYEAVKRHETYVARNHRLDGKSPYTGMKRATPPTQPTYRNRFPKTTAFAVSTGGADEPVTEEEDSAPEQGKEEDGQAAPENEETDVNGLFIPDFLSATLEENLPLAVRLAQTMQSDEKKLRKCYVCQKTDHLMRDCPVQKNLSRPFQPRGPQNPKSAQEPQKSKASTPVPQGSTPKPKASHT